MAITTIPASFRAGFAKIKELSPADFDVIVEALGRAPLVGGLKELASVVVQRVSSRSRQDIESILRSLFSLSVFLADTETPLAENLSNLSNAMQANGSPELALSDAEKSGFEARLSKLLSIRSVFITAKAQRLRLDYPKTCHEAMFLTDVRPVFDKPEERPVGCVVSQTLKITYHEDGEHKEFHVMLDAADLEMMKKAIQRAETKAASLKSVLRLANLPDLS